MAAHGCDDPASDPTTGAHGAAKLAEQGSYQDMPLRLLWRDSGALSVAQQAYGLSKIESMILLALEAEKRGRDRFVSYSRRKPHYQMPHRYRHPLYTYAKVPAAFDRLEALGLIEHERADPDRRYNRGRQSRARLRPEAALRLQSLTASPPREPLILRDAQGRPLDYRDTQRTHRERRVVQEINAALIGEGFPPLVRVWNRTLKRGGRFYAIGGGWQSMSSEQRQQLSIGGEPVVEIDYKSIHPAILYGYRGLEPPGDSYAIEGWPRPLVKVALLIAINAETEQAARLAVANHDAMAEVARPGTQEAIQRASALLGDLRDYHAPIADSFGSDAGAWLMGMDAEIAKLVMQAMWERHGETVLPVHDSFLVRASAADSLEEQMQRAAYDVVGFVLEVERKGLAGRRVASVD